MIYLVFFKSLIRTIKPIFFRFFSIIKYLVLALLAILLYLLVGRVGAWHVWDISSIIELQYNDTWHNRWLEHIDYANEFLSRWDAYYINDTHKQNPLWYNYSYAKWYKVLYLSNSIYWVFVFKKWTFTHTLGYPYGTTWFASFEIPTNWFLWKITNIFSSKKFKNIKATWNWFIFYNLNNDDIEITSHVCGREFPWYYFNHTTRGYPLKIFDFKNKLLYEYDGVPHAKAWPNSGGCWILPYLDEEANRIYNFTYSKTKKHNSSPIFVWWIISNTYVYHTNGNNRLFTDEYNELNSYKRFYIKWEQLATSKKPEQYQVEHEKEKDQYQSSPAYNTCQDDYNHVVSQSFSLINCKVFSQLYANQNTWFNYFNELLKDATQPFDWTGVSFLVGGEDPFKYVWYPDELKACKVRVEQENKYYKTKVDVPDSTWFIPDVEKRMMQYKIILKKQFLQTYSNASPMPSINDYCWYNTQYANSNVNNNPIDIKTQLKNDWEEIVSFINSWSYWRSWAIKDTRPIYVRIWEDLKNKYLNIQKKTFVSWLNNYCKENWNQFANNIYYFIIFLFWFYFIKMFK